MSLQCQAHRAHTHLSPQPSQIRLRHCQAYRQRSVLSCGLPAMLQMSNRVGEQSTWMKDSMCTDFLRRTRSVSTSENLWLESVTPVSGSVLSERPGTARVRYFGISSMS